jgi:SPP1 family phage portal protein
LLAIIRYYDDYDVVGDKTFTIVEVIDTANVRRYKMDNSFMLLEEYPHYFGMVPVAIYKNNEEERGDFEAVISLIDAYDKMESDTLNDFEYFVDAYLALYGYTADSDEVAKMKEDRILLMDEGTSAEWLIKQTSDAYIENMKNRLDKDIHKFAKCPNMSD